MEIQKIDIDQLFKSNADLMRSDLISSLRGTGFAVITGFNIRNLDGIYDTWLNDFFKAPLEEKLRYKFDPTQDIQPGYFPYKSENAKGESNPDLKEFYHVYNVMSDLPKQVLMKDMIGYSIDVYKVYERILSIISYDIFGRGLFQKYQCNPEQVLPRAVQGGNTLLRIIYYPEIENNEVGVRAAAHEDINLITLLPASTNPGLQVKDAQGNWHDVGTNPGDIIVNVGDMLQMLSKGEYKSTTHRVINLPGDRLSMPMFVHPRSDFSLGEMTAGEYLRQRLEEIGLK